MKMLRWMWLALALAAGMLATTYSKAADDTKSSDDTQDLGTFQVGPSQRMKVNLDEGHDYPSELTPTGKFKLKPFKPTMSPLKPMVEGGSGITKSSGETPRIEQPVVLSAPVPQYPDAALQNRLEGYVDVEFTIDSDGGTDNINIVDADPEGVFDLAARRAVERWRFKPYRVNGEPQPKRMTQRIKFDLPAGAGSLPDAGGSASKQGPSVREPIAESTPAPEYPARAARRHITGYVVVQYTVTASGETDNVEVISSQPARLFDRAVVSAVSRWRFKPALENGKPVAKTVKQRIKFSR